MPGSSQGPVVACAAYAGGCRVADVAIVLLAEAMTLVDGLLDGRIRPSERRSPFFAIPLFRTNFRRVAGAVAAAGAVLAGWWIFR